MTQYARTRSRVVFNLHPVYSQNPVLQLSRLSSCIMSLLHKDRGVQYLTNYRPSCAEICKAGELIANELSYIAKVLVILTIWTNKSTNLDHPYSSYLASCQAALKILYACTLDIYLASIRKDLLGNYLTVPAPLSLLLSDPSRLYSPRMTCLVSRDT
jgi:hypothetical protein